MARFFFVFSTSSKPLLHVRIYTWYTFQKISFSSEGHNYSFCCYLFIFLDYIGQLVNGFIVVVLVVLVIAQVFSANSLPHHGNGLGISFLFVLFNSVV